MSWKSILRLAELTISAILATSLFLAWRAERTDRAKLAAELASAQQSLTQATDRQQSRDADLVRTLASLATLKREIQTPAQILQSIPQQLPLPQPITMSLQRANSTWTSANAPAANLTNPNPNASAKSEVPIAPKQNAPKPTTPEPQAIIPAADLKPLYDFALDCKACQAELTTAQSDLADEKTKTATLTKERDAAIRTANGGSTLQRFARAAKWLLIGAAAGTLAAHAAK